MPGPTSKLRVLFISHEAAREGAPTSLLEIVRYVARVRDWDLSVIIRAGRGPLLGAFQSCARVWCWENEVRRPAKLGWPLLRAKEHRLWLFRRSWTDWARVAIRRQWLRILLTLRPPALIYSNTIMNGDVLRRLNKRRVPVIVHVREMDGPLAELDVARRRALLELPVAYFAASEAVKKCLSALGAPPERIWIVPPSVDVEQVEQSAALSSREAVRSSLGLSDCAFVIGMIGTACRTKGVDLFLDTAMAASRFPALLNAVFLWVGDGPEMSMLEKAAEGPLRGRLCLVGRQTNPYPYFKALDALFLSSRQDSFPRVNLEAGLLEVPIVAFEASGGAREFIGQDAGLMAPGLDVEAAAQCLARLAADETLRKRLGENARRKVLGRFATETVGRRVVTLLDGVLTEAASRAATACGS